jgi:NAD(P)-dependent dehydrogenase (short-subunit alcohol dehydrogenase family)
MITNFKGKTAVLTGGASGFGLECARIGAKLGMNLVLVDVQQDALDKARAELEAQGVQVLAQRVDVSNAEQMQRWQRRWSNALVRRILSSTTPAWRPVAWSGKTPWKIGNGSWA